MQNIGAKAAQALLAQGALLVDIRTAEEYAREHIDGARHVPAGDVAAGMFAQTVIFHCRSGHRTQMYAETLRGSAQGGAYVLEGGIDGWKRAGLPVVRKAGQPMELQRQVQIAAGGLILLGVLLGWLAHPGFYALAGLVGAGLVFAGLSGFCGMARVLARMPWNRSMGG